MPLRLDQYQREVAQSLVRRAGAGGDRATAVIAASVVEWSELQLSGVCPALGLLLTLDGRFGVEVRSHLDTGGRPTSLHRWGLAFAEQLAGDVDPWVAWAARVDSATLRGTTLSPAEMACPGDPIRSLMCVLAGSDPRV